MRHLHWHDTQVAAGKKIASKLLRVIESIKQLDSSDLGMMLSRTDALRLREIMAELTGMSYHYDPQSKGEL